MISIGLSLYHTGRHTQAGANNAAPSAVALTLNFDLVANLAPVGNNVVLGFSVAGPEAPPPPNVAPTGANVTLDYTVTAAGSQPPPNAAPTGSDQNLTYTVVSAS